MGQPCKTFGLMLLLMLSLHVFAQDGQQIFQYNCAACHGNEGGGGIGPALAGNEELSNLEHVINQILHGGGGMPAFAEEFSNTQVAAVATYIRTSWGNSFGEVAAQQVAQQRGGEHQEHQSQAGSQEQQASAEQAAQQHQHQEQNQEDQGEQQEQKGSQQDIPELGRRIVVKQEPGKVVLWILPGPRRISEQVFGTPNNPLHTGEHATKMAEGAVKDLFKEFPIIAGLPVEMRGTNEDITKYTHTTRPTPVSDEFAAVSGSFEATYIDQQPYDLPWEASETLDAVEFSTSFTDPDGNEYEIRLKRLYQPPFPGWQTGGGVITDSWIHGSTETDSPLFPKSFAYGAFWGVGDLIVNGEVVDEDKWVHLMTTQIVRNQDYELVTDEELPLTPDEAYGGNLHHTHLIVRPIKITPDGPVFEPVNTAFKLPNGQDQPFIHVMFEEETIVEDTFKNWLEYWNEQQNTREE